MSPDVGGGRSAVTVHRLAAFSDDPAGGNPAGVVVTEVPLPEAVMREIAAEVGYSETAFLVPTREGAADHDVRYFAPDAEVPFCGHATIAAGVHLGRTRGPGRYVLTTRSGRVPVDVVDHDGVVTATLTSVAPRSREAAAPLVEDVLAIIGWRASDLDPSLPPRLVHAGAWHLLLTASTRARLAELTSDVPRLRAVLAPFDIVTVALVWLEGPGRIHARNLFAPGGVAEDPATGAAAAALGGHLREVGWLAPPATVEVVQGVEMGRASTILVSVPAGDGGIAVTGTAVPLPPPATAGHGPV